MYCKSCGAAVVGKYCSCCGARVRTIGEELRLIEHRMRREFVREKADLFNPNRTGSMVYGHIADACWTAGCVRYGNASSCDSIEAGEERIRKIDKFARWVYSMVIVAVIHEMKE